MLLSLAAIGGTARAGNYDSSADCIQEREALMARIPRITEADARLSGVHVDPSGHHDRSPLLYER